MKELRQADPTLHKILPAQKLRPGARYRRSVFAVPYPDLNEDRGGEGKRDGDRLLWFNTLTRQLVEPVCRLPDAGEVVAAEEAEADPELLELVRNFFLVPEDADETARYIKLYQIMHALIRTKDEKGFTIGQTGSGTNAGTAHFCPSARPLHPAPASRPAAGRCTGSVLRNR